MMKKHFEFTVYNLPSERDSLVTFSENPFLLPLPSDLNLIQTELPIKVGTLGFTSPHAFTTNGASLVSPFLISMKSYLQPYPSNSKSPRNLI